MRSAPMSCWRKSGRDVSQFRSAAAFASWLGLCPQTDKSGGRVLSARIRTKNRLNRALRLAAQALHRSESYLGNFYRRMRSRLGAPTAITATAHKWARILFHLLRTGEAYDESIFAVKEQRCRVRLEHRLRRQARQLGYDLTVQRS